MSDANSSAAARTQRLKGLVQFPMLVAPCRIVHDMKEVKVLGGFGS
jgi:hypothetical protein